MQVELRNHPSQARHPVTHEPLVDAEGKPVPKIVDQKAVYLDGSMIGYALLACKPPKLSLIVPPRTMPPHIRDMVAAEVEKLLGQGLAAVKQVPDRPVEDESPEEVDE